MVLSTTTVVLSTTTVVLSTTTVVLSTTTVLSPLYYLHYCTCLLWTYCRIEITISTPTILSHEQSVVELQKQVIACKDDQLQLLQKTVTSSVQSVKETVKEEFRSYSSVV